MNASFHHFSPKCAACISQAMAGCRSHFSRPRIHTALKTANLVIKPILSQIRDAGGPNDIEKIHPRLSVAAARVDEETAEVAIGGPDGGDSVVEWVREVDTGVKRWCKVFAGTGEVGIGAEVNGGSGALAGREGEGGGSGQAGESGEEGGEGSSMEMHCVKL